MIYATKTICPYCDFTQKGIKKNLDSILSLIPTDKERTLCKCGKVIAPSISIVAIKTPTAKDIKDGVLTIRQFDEV